MSIRNKTKKIDNSLIINATFTKLLGEQTSETEVFNLRSSTYHADLFHAINSYYKDYYISKKQFSMMIPLVRANRNKSEIVSGLLLRSVYEKFKNEVYSIYKEIENVNPVDIANFIPDFLNKSCNRA